MKIARHYVNRNFVAVFTAFAVGITGMIPAEAGATSDPSTTSSVAEETTTTTHSENIDRIIDSQKNTCRHLDTE